MAAKSYFSMFNGGVDYVDNWFLMQSAYPTAFIIAAYLIFVLKLGPMYMKGSRPYELRSCLLAYNVAQVMLSTVVFVRVFRLMHKTGIFERTCLLNNSPEIQNTKYELLSVHHLYYVAKITELLDTIFFVLRKKWSQISFLHVYHHSAVTVFSWIGLKYEPSFSYLMLGLLNSFVHIIMYAYYGLSAFPRLNRYLWWKKYITKLQLAQFIALILHIMANHYVSNCPNSKLILFLYLYHMTLFTYLFGQFYVQCYIKKKQGTVDLKTKAIRNGKTNLNGSFENGVKMTSELNSKFDEKLR